MCVFNGYSLNEFAINEFLGDCPDHTNLRFVAQKTAISDCLFALYKEKLPSKGQFSPRIIYHILAIKSSVLSQNF